MQNITLKLKIDFEVNDLFHITNNYWSLHSYFLKQFNNSNLRFMKSILKNTLVANIPGNIIVFFGISSLSIVMYIFSQKNIPVENSIALFGAIIFAFQKILSQSQIIYSNYVKIKFTRNSAVDVLKIFEIEKFRNEKFLEESIS